MIHNSPEQKAGYDWESVRFVSAYRLLEDAIAAKAFPGCAFGVLFGGETVLLDGLGRFTFEDDAQLVQPMTVFDVASLTKVVATTAMAMLLWQRGRLDLETPLGELLPGFVVGRPAGSLARHVKVRHLLAHNSGLPGYVELFKSTQEPTQLMRACLALSVEKAPGERAEYSDPGFILLGKVLEVVGREQLSTWLHREVFTPLGMSATRFNPATHARHAIPPTENDHSLRQRIIQGEVQDENAWVLKGVAGHAGLFSNVSDLLRLAREVLAAGTNGALFSAETVEKFASRQEPAGSSRALGWDTPSENSSAGKYFSSRSVGHLGFSGCSLWIDREANVAVVLLTNRTWPDRTNRAIREIRPAFHNAVREALELKAGSS